MIWNSFIPCYKFEKITGKVFGGREEEEVLTLIRARLPMLHCLLQLYLTRITLIKVYIWFPKEVLVKREQYSQA